MFLCLSSVLFLWKDHDLCNSIWELPAFQSETTVILALAGMLRLPKTRSEMLIVHSKAVQSCSKSAAEIDEKDLDKKEGFT